MDPSTEARAQFRAMMAEVASRSKVAAWLSDLLQSHKTADALRAEAYGETGRAQ